MTLVDAKSALSSHFYDAHKSIVSRFQLYKKKNQKRTEQQIKLQSLY